VSITAHSAVLRCICWCFTVRWLRYVVGHGVRVTVGGMVIRASWRVRYGMWVTTWVTLCGWWCHGHDVWITLRGKHYVADAVQITLRGSWCVSIHTRVETQFRST